MNYYRHRPENRGDHPQSVLSCSYEVIN